MLQDYKITSKNKQYANMKQNQNEEQKFWNIKTKIKNNKNSMYKSCILIYYIS